MPAGDLAETRFYGAMTVVGNAIFLTNLFFDWTVIGWVAALIWCSTTNPVDRYKEGDA